MQAQVALAVRQDGTTTEVSNKTSTGKDLSEGAFPIEVTNEKLKWTILVTYDKAEHVFNLCVNGKEFSQLRELTVDEDHKSNASQKKKEQLLKQSEEPEDLYFVFTRLFREEQQPQVPDSDVLS